MCIRFADPRDGGFAVWFFTKAGEKANAILPSAGPELTLPPDSDALKRVQIFPQDAVIDSLSMRFTATEAFLIGDITDFHLTLYTSEGSETTFARRDSVSCKRELDLGHAIVGSVWSEVCSGLSFPVTAGTAGILVAELWALALPAVVKGQLATSIGFASAEDPR